MKRFLHCFFIVFCLVLFLTSCYYIAEDKKLQNGAVYDDNLSETVFFPDVFNQNGQIYYFIKVHGFLKVHTDKSSKDIDKLFFDYYPKINNNTDKQEFNNILDEFIFEIYGTVPDTAKHENPRYSWLNDTTYFHKELKNKLLVIENNFIKKKKKSSYYQQDIFGNFRGIIRPKIKYKPNDVDSLFPDQSTRIWGIANYWNLVNYFWVYKKMMDADWDKILYETILPVQNAENEIEYAIAIMKFIAHTDDSHAYVHSDLIDNAVFGRYVPNIRLCLLNDTILVKSIRTERKECYSDTIFKVGDIIYSINNTPLIQLYDSLKHLHSASNEERRKRQVLGYVVSSFQKSNQMIYSRDGKMDTVTVDFDDFSAYNRFQWEKKQDKKQELTVQNLHGTGYIHIDDLFEQNFEKNTNELKKFDEIIIDMRGYPNPKISIKLSNVFFDKISQSNDYLYPYIYLPGKIKRIPQTKNSGRKNEFINKKIVVLVDETTISQAEFLTMLLQQREDVKVVGSRTAGSDGPVITIDLPGKITTGLTSLGILYPDGTQTQRYGIRLDAEVKLTVAGIQAGKDEILEKGNRCCLIGN